MTRRAFIISIILGCGVFAASCTVDQPVAREGGRVPILFQAPAVSSATKTSAGYPNHEMPTSYNTAERFSVFATDATVPFASLDAAGKSRYYMNDEPCAYVAQYDAWAPETPFYWLPSVAGTFYLNFQAYSPAVAGEDCTLVHDWDSGFQFNGFVPRTPGEQYDLLYSDRHLDKQRPDYNPNGGAPYDEDSGDLGGARNGIDIHFHHALTSIVFQVMAKVPEDAIQQIHLQKLTLKNVWNKGSFSQNIGGTESWTLDPDAVETEYVVYPGSGAASAGELLREGRGFVTVENALMIVPQSLLHTSGNHVTLEITYTRTIVATGKRVTATETADLVNGNNGSYYEAAIGSGPAQPITSFDQGHRYTFRLTLNLYKVLVDPSVGAWNDFTPEQNNEL